MCGTNTVRYGASGVLFLVLEISTTLLKPVGLNCKLSGTRSKFGSLNNAKLASDMRRFHGRNGERIIDKYKSAVISEVRSESLPAIIY